METKNRYPYRNVGIALPENLRHRNLITNVLPSLKKLDITVFFVDEKGNVETL